MRWVIRRRDLVERETLERERLRDKVKSQQNALARLGHARDQAYREAAETLKEMRLYAFEIDRDHSGFQRVVITMRVASPMLVEGYRRNGTVREIVSYMLEQELHRSEIGRRAMIGDLR